MNQPNYPNQGYQDQGQPGYPPAQPGYQNQGYSNQAPPQGYQYPAPPQGYQYPAPPQGYQNPNQPPPPPRRQLGLGDFLNQPALGFGPGLSTKNYFRAPGQAITVQVARDVGAPDVRPDLDANKNPRSFPDGRERTVLVIPVFVPELNGMFPGGQATVWAKGQLWGDMTRAMGAAGVPPREDEDFRGALIPEAGARMTITFMGTKETGGGFNNANVWQVTYYRPQDGNAPPVGAGQGGNYAPPQAQYQQGPPPQQYQQGPPPGYQGTAPGQYQQGPPQQQGYGQGQPPQQYQQGPPPVTQLPGQYQGAPQGQQGPAAQVAGATQAGVQAATQYPQVPQDQAQPVPSYQQPVAPQDQGQAPPSREDLISRLTQVPAPQPQQ